MSRAISGQPASIGFAYFLGLAALLVPLLPFLATAWLTTRAMERLRGETGRE